jgi:hypothetical protein
MGRYLNALPSDLVGSPICCADGVDRRSINAIAVLLSMVLETKHGESRRHDVVLFHQLSAVHDHDLRHWRVVLPKSVLSRSYHTSRAGGQITPAASS